MSVWVFKRSCVRSAARLTVGLTAIVASGTFVAGASAQSTPSGGSTFKLHAHDGQNVSYFGSAVAISYDGIAIQASWDRGTEFRAVYVFRCCRGYGGWQQQAKLRVPDHHIGGAELGFSMGFRDDAVVIGTMGGDENGWFSGMAHVFRERVRGPHHEWKREAKLLAADGASRDQFGSAVAVSDDIIVVGAMQDDDRGCDSGSAYVFRFNPDGSGRWVQEAKLVPDDGEAEDGFGSTAAVSGNTILVGVSRDDDLGPYSGSAYVFRYDGVAWIEERKLLADDGAAGDHFGWSVALSGDTAVIGAPYDDDGGQWAGSAYVFRFDRGGSNDWFQETKLRADDGLVEDLFGKSVSVSGDSILIGAPSGSRGIGAAYWFGFDGSGWAQEAKLRAHDGAPGDEFGWSVALEASTAVIGAPRDDDQGRVSGSAYVFDLDCVRICDRGANWQCDGDVDGDGQVNMVDAGLVQAAYCEGEQCGDDALCQYDLDCDGQVNPIDSGIVQSLFGTCEAPRCACP